MCGRFTLTPPSTDIPSFFDLDLDDVPLLTPRYNIAPTQPIATVRLGTEGRRELHEARWGLLPSWAKDRSKASHGINARSETAAEKPTFRAAFRSHRCLIPASGWYEWRAEGGRKQPYAILRRDGGLLAFAGLWEKWGHDGEVLETAAILTTSATAAMRPLHDRMPVILPREAWSVWLDPQRRTDEELAPLLVPFDDGLVFVPVSTYVSNARNQGPGCLEPVGPSIPV